MHADLSIIEARVRDAIGTSPAREHLKSVLVEADRDDEGSEFLRIILELTPLDNLSDGDLEFVVRSIEDDLSELDDRFPGIRFAEPA